ncbi:NAD-dependent epimerase/dehydratase family protein [Erwinia sp. AnSW2-5]|uniref:NAD-dependent epimerase/dehydratase family protein n=1 Tax=Erwinia sp. AnSW2-5 TaxID=3367692 RepID=UPI00385CF0A7
MATTVALTGMTGFIGRHIADNLLARGFSVRALTRSEPKTSVKNLTWIPGDLDQPESLSELVYGAESVVHCAGQVRGRSAAIFTHCNVTGSLQLLQAAKKSGHIKRFLFMSSLAARHPDLSWYAHSKYVAEQQLAAHAAGISLGIFRPTAVYGPGDKELKPLFTWLLRGVLPQMGAPTARLSFIHVSDLAQAVGQWLIAEPQPTFPYELCDGVTRGYSWQRLQQMGEEVRNGTVRLIPVPLPVLKLLADISLLSSRLTGKEPMLTRSKIQELTHPDWSASHLCLSRDIHWRPVISLIHALREGLF